MINNFPFFRLPFYPYSRNYPRNLYYKTNPNTENINTPSVSQPTKHTENINMLNASQSTKHTESDKNGNRDRDRNRYKNEYKNRDDSHIRESSIKEKKSSKYSSIGPILINTDGFSNKEEPILEFSGLKLYLDDLIILSILYFLYKEDVKDDVLFILLILLLIS